MFALFDEQTERLWYRECSSPEMVTLTVAAGAGLKPGLMRFWLLKSIEGCSTGNGRDRREDAQYRSVMLTSYFDWIGFSRRAARSSDQQRMSGNEVAADCPGGMQQ